MKTMQTIGVLAQFGVLAIVAFGLLSWHWLVGGRQSVNTVLSYAVGKLEAHRWEGCPRMPDQIPTRYR